MSVEPTRLLFTVAEYEALGQLEVFGQDRRLELIEGDIVEMTPIGPRHGSCVMRLIALFTARFGANAVVNVQNPVRLGNFSEPQPDLTLLAPGLERYRHRHPESDDILLLVEVSESSLRFDRQVKVPVYAREGVTEVWIVDLDGEAVELHREPSAQGYLSVERRGRGDAVAPQAFPKSSIAVDDILG